MDISLDDFLKRRNQHQQNAPELDALLQRVRRLIESVVAFLARAKPSSAL